MKMYKYGRTQRLQRIILFIAELFPTFNIRK